MSEPQYSVDFTARVVSVAGSEIVVGDALLFSPSYEYQGKTGYWVKATAANRAAASSSTEGIALTPYGGSAVGTVSYQSAGVLAQSVSGLDVVNASVGLKLVRVSTLGRLERLDTYTDADDLVGIAAPNGRVALMLGLPWQFLAALVDPTPPVDPVSLENIGGGEEVYAGTVDDVARLRTFIGANGALVSTSGSNIVVDVEAANLGDAEQIYAGVAADQLTFKTLRGAGVASLSSTGDEITITVPAAAAGAQEGVNLGAGEEPYKGLSGGGDLEFRTFTGTGVAAVTTIGDTINIDVPAASAGSQGGVNLGGGEEVFTALDGSNNLQFRTVTGTNAAAVTTVGNTINVDVATVPTITIGGSVADLMVKASSTSLSGVTGSEGHIPRRIGGAWTTEAPVEVPEGDANDVVGIDGSGGLINLGPMPSGGGGGGGGTSNVSLGGATPQILYKTGTDTIGGTTWEWISGGLRALVTSFIEWGTTNVASKGFMRWANATAAFLFAQRNSTNDGDNVGMGFSSTAMYLCCGSGISDPFPDGYVFPRYYLYLGVNRSTCLRMVYTGSVPYTEQYEPIIGGGGKPYGINGHHDFTPGTYAASASALSKHVWYFAGPVS